MDHLPHSHSGIQAPSIWGSVSLRLRVWHIYPVNGKRKGWNKYPMLGDRGLEEHASLLPATASCMPAECKGPGECPQLDCYCSAMTLPWKGSTSPLMLKWLMPTGPSAEVFWHFLFSHPLCRILAPSLSLPLPSCLLQVVPAPPGHPQHPTAVPTGPSAQVDSFHPPSVGGAHLSPFAARHAHAISPAPAFP